MNYRDLSCIDNPLLRDALLYVRWCHKVNCEVANAFDNYIAKLEDRYGVVYESPPSSNH